MAMSEQRKDEIRDALRLMQLAAAVDLTSADADTIRTMVDRQGSVLLADDGQTVSIWSAADLLMVCGIDELADAVRDDPDAAA